MRVSGCGGLHGAQPQRNNDFLQRLKLACANLAQMGGRRAKGGGGKMGRQAAQFLMCSRQNLNVSGGLQNTQK